MRVAVSSDVQAGSLSLAGSCDAAIASSAKKAASNLPSSGGVSATVVGRGGLSEHSASVGARIEMSACRGCRQRVGIGQRGCVPWAAWGS